MMTIIKVRNAYCDCATEADKWSWVVCEDFDVSKTHYWADTEEEADEYLQNDLPNFDEDTCGPYENEDL